MAKKPSIIVGCIVAAAVVVLIAVSIVVSIIINKDKHKDRTFNIEHVDIQLNGETVDSLEKICGDADFTLTALINNEATIDTKKYDVPTVEWSFIGNSLNCTVNNGVVHLGDTLGQTTIKVTVTSKNEVSDEIQLTIIKEPGSTIETISVADNFTEALTYIEGQPFIKDDYVIVADYGDYQANITGYDVDKLTLSLGDTWVLISYEGQTLQIPVIVIHKTLQSIEVKTPPTTISYAEGQTFDPTDMEIVAQYEYIHNVDVTDFIVDTTTKLVPSDTFVTISYTEDNISKTTIQAITVSPKTLQSISVDTTNAILDYVQGQRFSTADLVVTAHYEYIDQTVNDYTVSSELRVDPRLTWEDKSVTIGYGGKQYIVDITVDKPYSNIRTIEVADPLEVTLSWSYFYMTDSGEDKLEFNAFESHNSDYLDTDLTYDTINGIYEVPVGATVTVTALNTAILDFLFDGTSQGLAYPVKSLTFTFENGENPLVISTSKISDRRTIIFTDGTANLVLSYPILWNGLLTSTDLEQVAFIYDESNPNFVNTYSVLDEDRSFAQLSNLIDTGDLFVVVQVTKAEISSTDIAITVEYWEGLEVTVFVNAQDYASDTWKDQLPIIDRAGYTFNTWQDEGEYKVKALWIQNNPNYAESFVDTWIASNSFLTDSVNCEITLNADGTYQYKSWLNGVLNLDFSGFYQYDGNDITILSIETTDDLMLVSNGNFDFDLSQLAETPSFLTANILWISSDFVVYQLSALFMVEE